MKNSSNAAAWQALRRWFVVGASLLAGAIASGYDLITDPSGIYIVAWKPGAVPMKVKLATSPALSDGTSQSGSVVAAMQAWNAQLGTVQFQWTELGEGSPDKNDNGNEIVMSSTIYGDAFDANTLAVTLSFRSGNERTESDIIFNTAYQWDSFRGGRLPSNTAAQDIRRVAIHELGHVLGLTHPDQATPPQSVNAIMNSRVSYSPAVDALQSDDIAGARSMYGAPGFVPPNDNFANATTITLSTDSTQVSGTNVAATAEAGEPSLDGDDPGRKTVWWRWTAPSAGSVTVTTLGSNFDTLLGVYTGSAVNALTQIGLNDDVQSGVVRTSSVSFDSTPGTTYYFAVDGWGGYAGTIKLNLSSSGPIPPVITSDTAQTSFVAGFTSTYTVRATGLPAPGYQWQQLAPGGDWTNLTDGPIFSGTLSPSLTVLGVVSLNGAQLRCVVSNAGGEVTSRVRVLRVDPAPDAVGWISFSFPSQAFTGTQINGTATVMNVGSNTWDSSYELVIYGHDGRDLAVGSLAGVGPGNVKTVNLGFLLPIQPASYAFTLRVRSVAAGWFGSARSFTTATSGAPIAPNIVQQPVSQTANVGATVSFSVAALGQTPFSYQWRLNGADIAGATSATLTLTNVQLTAAGDYTVRVANALGFAISEPAGLQIKVPPGVVSVWAGGTYTMFLRSDGSRWGVGNGNDGNFGDGTISSYSLPTEFGSDYALLASLLVKLDGSLWVTGLGAGGLAGLGTGQWVTPVPVVNGSDVAALGSGSFFVRSDGSLWGAGRNSAGQLGDGTTVERVQPVRIAEQVAAVANGSFHTLFLKADGSVWGMGGGGSEGPFNTGYPDNYSQNINVPILLAENVVDIAAGYFTSVFLKKDKTVWAVGSGQPLRQIATGAARVIASGEVILVLMEDGTLWGLGNNGSGQLGDGTMNNRRETLVQIASDVHDASTGANHTVFVKNDGSLWGTGLSANWQLGSLPGSRTLVPVQLAAGIVATPVAPTELRASDGEMPGIVRLSWNFVRGASGYEIWRGATSNQADAMLVAKVFGRRLYFDQTVSGDTFHYWVRATSPGRTSAFSAAAQGRGSAVSSPTFSVQPRDVDFILGSGTLAQFTATATGSPAPRYLWQKFDAASSAWVDMDARADGFDGVRTGTLSVNPTVAERSHGSRYRCVATNSAGSAISQEVTLRVITNPPEIVRQPRNLTTTLGLGGGFEVIYGSAIPATIQWKKNGVPIPGATSWWLPLRNIRASDVGDYTAQISSAAGTATSAVAKLQLVPSYGVVFSAAGSADSLFVRADQTLWGMGSHIIHPDGGSVVDRTWPHLIASGVISAAVGDRFFVYVKSDGTLWHAGRYFYPGPPSTIEIFTPSPGSYRSTSVPRQLATDVVKVVAGKDHIAYLTTDGALWTMGANTHGQIGDGTLVQRDLPVKIAEDVTAVVAAGRTTFFIKSDHSLWASGDNSFGQLGDGTTTRRPTPFEVAANVATVGAGGSHTVFLKRDGTLWGMGLNSAGELGDAVPAPVMQDYTYVSGYQLVPVQIGTAARIMVGPSATFFQKPDGTTWAMGNNSLGRLGDGTTTSTRLPVQIAAANLEQSAAADHVLFVRADGSLWGVGNNYDGELGDGTTSAASVPKLIASGPMGVDSPPLFVTQPTDRSIALGNSDTFRVAVNGVPIPELRWERSAAGTETWVALEEGGAYSGVDGTVLTITPASTAVSGDRFRCVATNSLGTAVSDAATLAITVPLPLITRHPLGQPLVSGAVFRLEVSVMSPVAVTYQWFRDGELLPGATSASYDIADFGAETDGDYTVVVTNSRGSVTSNVATLLLVTPPAIQVHPVSFAGPAGRNVNFVVYASSQTPMTYQWYKNGTLVQGATGVQFGITSAQAADVGHYSVVIANMAGSVTSNAASLTLLYGPVFTRHPAIQAVVEGGTATYTVAATGTGPINFQWQRWRVSGGPWIDIPGATTDTLVLADLPFSSHGDQVRCVVTNVVGSSTSNVAGVGVSAASVLRVSAGRYHSFRLNAGGRAFASGQNTLGQLGTGSTTSATSPQVVTIPEQKIVDVVAGPQHTLFLTAEKRLYATGNNATGQLGDGTLVAKSAPILLATDVAAMAAGFFHNAYVKTDGTLWTVGGNDSGQLGTGDTTNRTTPVQIATDVVDVSAGIRQTLFVKSDGSLWIVGNRDGGESFISTPVQIATDVRAVSAGGYHTLFLKHDATLWSFGYNNSGQLGDGSTTSRLTPQQIATDVRAISAGYFHSTFVKSDHTLWTTGLNGFGQLGTGGSANRTTSQQAASNVATVSASEGFTLFTKRDGSVWGVGLNSSGQFGNGNTTTSSAAVQIATGTLGVPAKPASFTASAAGSPGRVRLLWPPAPDALSYEVWRGAANNSAAATLLASGLRWAYFEDTDAGSGTSFYWVKAVNPAGTSAFSAVANAAGVPVQPPQITTQPASQSANVGGSVSFTVVATGDAPLSYQWRRGDSDLPTATSATLTLNPLLYDDRGDYRVVVTNTAGSVTSDIAVLSVNKLAQTITFASPAGRAFTATPFALSATASSGLPVSFTLVNGPATLASNTLTLTGPGTVVLRAEQAGDATYAAASAVERSFVVTANFTSWQNARFTGAELLDSAISGLNADPDGDGLGNLLEYALGHEPRTATTADLPEVGATANAWTYTYTRPADRAALTYVVETSTDLVTWTTANVTHALVSTTEGRETWRASVPLTTANAYFRLKVTQP